MGKKCVFTFGRFQVPTKGHEELVRFVMTYAQRTGAEGRIYPSKSQDANKNPLAYRDKVQFLRLLFPWANVVDDPKAVNAFAICRELSDKGYDDVTFVVGDDRVASFENTIKKYILPKNDPKFDKTKNYAFKKFNVISSGARHEGVSGTDMRNYIRTGNFDKFFAVAPTKNKALAKRIFNSAKRNLNESVIDEATARDITKHLSKNGWRKQREGANHEVWHHPETNKSVAIPRHKGDFKKGLVHGIMKHTMVAEEVKRKEFHGHLEKFVDFCCDYLGIEEQPKLRYKEPSEQGEQPSFAAYSPSLKEVIIMSKNRHPMDVFRSVAHELVHHKQNEDGRLGKDVAQEGATGSDIENEANSEAGKIMRYFGKAYPDYFNMSYVIEQTLEEGIHDDHTFKLIFLAGGAGSGKDYILHNVIRGGDTYSNSLKELNMDQAYKHLMQKAGLDLKMPAHEQVPRDKVREKSRVVHKKNTQIKTDERLGLIINGTGDDYERIKNLKGEYEALGYETMMIFVTTNNKVSRSRNVERGRKGDREIPENIRFRTWRDAMNNKDKFAALFGKDRFIAIDNSTDNRYATPDQKTAIERSHRQGRSLVLRFLAAPIKNPTALSWIAAQKAKRGINEKFEDFICEVGGAGNFGTPQLTSRYQKDTPGQPIGFREMRVMNFNKKLRQENVPADAKAIRMPKVPIGADRIGSEVGMPKDASFGDNQSMSITQTNDPIGRWMVKEETRKLFKRKYGRLAEQKIKETAMRLVQRESLDDPYSSSMGATSNAGNGDITMPTGGNQVDSEKQSIYGLKLRRKLNNKK